jgi:hypothetical protein
MDLDLNSIFLKKISYVIELFFFHNSTPFVQNLISTCFKKKKKLWN